MITMIDVRELDELLPRGDIFIVDLREPEEYRKSHLRGAKNLPYEKMKSWEERVLSYKKILLYCDRGSESQIGRAHV